MIDITISDADIDKLVTDHNARTIDIHKHWNFDAARRHVIKSWDDVQACPGSGKTTLVAAKLLILAKKWKELHRGICVLTHTNVARDEIISRLHDHPAGFKLTSYPHFIGTIQEFVNRHLGLPYVRTRYAFKRLVDGTEGQLEVRRAQIDGHTIQQICRNLYHTCNRVDYEEIKNYLGSLHYINAQEDLRFFKQNNSSEVSLASSTCNRRRMLSSLKEALCNAGIYQYRDMYAFSDKLISENLDLIPALRKRFPIVLIDEMQDTQKFQENLLDQIFDDEIVCIQRLGDPDQAIFDGIGGEESNENYNDNDNLIEIKTTHRFGNDICDKIIGLSCNRLDQLSSNREPNIGEFQHTVFLYDDESRIRILDAFGDLVAQSDTGGHWQNVKAVGSVEGSGGHISLYWPGYDKNKSVRSPRPKKLIHIVYFCLDKTEGHVSGSYDYLIQGVVDLLRKANIKTTNKEGNSVYFSRRSLVRWLRETEKFHQFRKLLTVWIIGEDCKADSWTIQIELLISILGLDELNEEATKFLEFDAGNQLVNGNRALATNIYSCLNGRQIEVGTIHSVKGETHDTTLILETKYNQNDLEQVLPFLIDISMNRPTGVRKIEFMRKLYVAASRPRHLLCLAVHQDHINTSQRIKLSELGWNISDVR